MGRPVLFMTFLAAVGLITWQELRLYARAPRPERYVYAALVWALLGIVSEMGGDDIAAAFSVGLVLTLVYQFYRDKGSIAATQENRVQQNQAVRHATEIGG